MTKNYRCFAALALALASSQAFALGLGTIVVKSQLDEPLLAEIPVIGASPEEASGLHARLAAPNEIERAGVDASRGSAPVELQVVETKDGRTVIRVTTRSAVHDPMMAFLVNVTWSSGRVLREYKVTFAGSSAGSASTVTQATPEPERAAPAAPPPPPKPKAAPAEASKPKAAPAETKPVVAAQPSPPPPAKPVAAEPKPQPAKATPAPAPAPAPVPAKPVATEPKAAPPAAPLPKPVAAEAKPVPAPAKAPPPPAPPASPAAETKASAPAPKTEAPVAPQSAAAAKPVAAPPAAAPKPVASPPASPGATSAPVDPHAELERAKSELAAKEAESSALRARLAELEKSQPANRERLEQENKKLEDTEHQLNQMASQVDAQQQAVAQTPPAGSAPPPPAAPVPAGSGDAEPAPANVPAPTGSTSPTGTPDAGATPRTAPGSEPSPPPSPEFRWYDDWLIPGGIGIALLLVASLALMRMRRGRIAAAPSFGGALAAEPEFDLSETEPAFGDAAADAVDFSAVAPDAPVDTEEQFNLLRLLYLRGDATGFEQAARHIYELDPDPDLWRRIAEMGRMVSPDNALFADAGGGIKRMEFDLPELSTPVPAEAMIESEPELHERLFEPEHPTPPPPIAEPPVTDATEHEAIPLEPLEAAAPEPDPWADDSAAVAMPVHVHPAYAPAPPVTADEQPADADVEPEGGTDDATPAATAPPAPPPAASTASRPTSAVEDPVDTKLELAIAYLEMGDADAARHMLDEVMDEGDSRQKAEALKLREEAGGGQRSA